jgi:hypothetical protein
VFDAAGKQLGAVRQTGQSTLKKALRLVSSVDQFMTHTLEVTDATGVTQLTLTRPAKVFKSTVVVQRPDGSEVGRVVQENMIGKIKFRIETDGQRLGTIQGENWIAWNFAIKDANDTEIARMTKTFEASRGPRSPRRTTTSCRSTSICRNPCAHSWWPRHSAWTSRSSKTTAGSTSGAPADALPPPLPEFDRRPHE